MVGVAEFWQVWAAEEDAEETGPVTQTRSMGTMVNAWVVLAYVAYKFLSDELRLARLVNHLLEQTYCIN